MKRDYLEEWMSCPAGLPLSGYCLTIGINTADWPDKFYKHMDIWAEKEEFNKEIERCLFKNNFNKLLEE